MLREFTADALTPLAGETGGRCASLAVRLAFLVALSCATPLLMAPFRRAPTPTPPQPWSRLSPWFFFASREASPAPALVDSATRCGAVDCRRKPAPEPANMLRHLPDCPCSRAPASSRRNALWRLLFWQPLLPGPGFLLVTLGTLGTALWASLQVQSLWALLR